MLSCKSVHGRKRLHKNFSHLPALKIACCEHEHSHPGPDDRAQFKSSVSDSSIFRENYPPSSPSLLKPILIPCILGKVIVVYLYLYAGLAEGSGNLFLSEGSIEEETERARQPRLRARI